MKKSVILLLINIVAMTGAHAQNFLEHLQQNQGKGSVTVTQSKDISDLVNGKNAQTATTSAVPVRKNAAEKKNATKHPTMGRQDEHHTTVIPQIEHTERQAETESKTVENKTAENKSTEGKNIRITDKRHTGKNNIDNENEDFNIPTVDMRKKVMAKSYKVTGYRVQAFAGGNTRHDRQQAESIGSNIKMKFPDQPVYVHFYSPRWICRVGNYRSLGEANRMLKAIHDMGYRSACLVKGKITVQH